LSHGIGEGYQKGLVLLILSFVLSVILLLLFTNFVGYGETILWNRYIFLLLFLQSILGAITFLPFFAAYGWCEFAGYRVGVKIFSSQGRMVYGIYLAGLGCAYLLMRWSLPLLGLFRFIPLSFLIILASLSIHRKRVTLRSALLSALLLTVSFPDLEPQGIRLLDLKRDIGGINAFFRQGAHTLFQGWGLYCHLTFMRLGNDVQGFYDRRTIWMIPGGKPENNVMPLLVQFGYLKEKASIVIIGAGGGKQVKEALEISPRKVVAVEVVPEVFDLLAGPYANEIGGLLNDPRVELVRSGGRQYLEKTKETFDLIYLSSVEVLLSGFRTLLEPSMYLYTNEAIRLYISRLKPGGLLFISKSSAADKNGTIFYQTGASLRSMGWKVEGVLGQWVPWEGPVELWGSTFTSWYILAHQDYWPPLPSQFLKQIQTSGYRYLSASEWKDVLPITDDNPYSVSIFASFSIREIIEIILAYMIVVGLPLLFLFMILIKKSYNYLTLPRRSVKSIPQFINACLLVGCNFMLLENFVIFQLYQVLSVPLDAVFVGTLFFLCCAFLGNALIPRRQTSLLTILIVLSLGIVVVSVWFRHPLAAVLAASPLYFLTGRFFPAVFQGPPHQLAAVFILDLVGTILGGGIALFLPIISGFRIYNFICIIVLLSCHYAISRLPKPLVSR